MPAKFNSRLEVLLTSTQRVALNRAAHAAGMNPTALARVAIAQYLARIKLEEQFLADMESLHAKARKT